MNNFKAISMPCTEEQWLNEVKPLCDKYGLKYKHIGNFKVLELLANLVWGEKVITNLSKDDCNIKNFELIPYNPIEFIKACGIEELEGIGAIPANTYTLGTIGTNLAILEPTEQPKINDKMKVRIVKAKKDTFWYSEKIGKIFEVKEYGKKNYVLVANINSFIDKDDCEIVVEPTEQPKPKEVRCTKKGQEECVRVTNGKIYQVLKEDENYYYLRNNAGNVLGYSKLSELFVEVEQPKWEKLTRGGYKIIELKEALGWWIVKIILHSGIEFIYPCEPSGRNKGGNPNFDLIPYNPRKTELLTKKAELEKQLEEINKELNQ